MASINHFDLRSFDLNLLVAFDALMHERSVTRAAARLKVGQPAMSHNLSTLRVLLQDELFVRVGSAIQPTARAVSLAGPIRAALAQMQAALHAPAMFDPRTEERTIRIGFSGELELLLIPDLTETMRRAAPGLRLLSQRAGREEVHRLLDEGSLDIAVGCFEPSTARRYRSKVLFEPSLSCIFNPQRLPLSPPIELADYSSSAARGGDAHGQPAGLPGGRIGRDRCRVERSLCILGIHERARHRSERARYCYGADPHGSALWPPFWPDAQPHAAETAAARGHDDLVGAAGPGPCFILAQKTDR